MALPNRLLVVENELLCFRERRRSRVKQTVCLRVDGRGGRILCQTARGGHGLEAVQQTPELPALLQELVVLGDDRARVAEAAIELDLPVLKPDIDCPPVTLSEL